MKEFNMVMNWANWQDIYPPIHLTDSDFAVITQARYYVVAASESKVK
jgi:hypothetical protein